MTRYQKKPRQTFAFVFIASLLMIVTDLVFFPMTKTPEKAGPYIIPEKIYEHSEIEDFEMNAAISRIKREEPEEWVVDVPRDIPQPEPIKNNAESLAKMIKEPATLKIDQTAAPPVIPPTVPAPLVKGQGKVVVIIDDMGMDRKRSREAMELPGPLTLAFLPYAPKLDEITKEAKAKGHELIIHVPMQPMSGTLDPGPLVLRDDMSEEGFHMALEKIFASFEGYVGINNHMGSKLTQDRKAMDMLMEALVGRRLIFVDSKTIPTSVAAQSAAEHGLAYAERDVFLDHVNDKSFVMKSLNQLEIIARRRGYAIAIGHPKDATIEGLKEWLPLLKEKNLTLVPVSAVAHMKEISKPETTTEPATVFRPSVSYSSELFGPRQPPRRPQPLIPQP